MTAVSEAGGLNPASQSVLTSLAKGDVVQLEIIQGRVDEGADRAFTSFSGWLIEADKCCCPLSASSLATAKPPFPPPSFMPPTFKPPVVGPPGGVLTPPIITPPAPPPYRPTTTRPTFVITARPASPTPSYIITPKSGLSSISLMSTFDFFSIHNRLV